MSSTDQSGLCYWITQNAARMTDQELAAARATLSSRIEEFAALDMREYREALAIIEAEQAERGSK